MKKIETTYTIKLSSDEIELITTALHGEYKFLKELSQSTKQDDVIRANKKLNNVRELRNNFASIIDRRYLGEDA